MTAGRAYRIQVLGTPGVDCTLLAPIVESLQDASGRVVAGTEWWDESREQWSRLTFTPATDGRYYISVVGEANYGGIGAYIVALTDGGSGSDERITAIGAQGCVPEAPAGLGLSEVTGGSVTLSWTAPAHSAISGYRILRGTDASTLAVIAHRHRQHRGELCGCRRESVDDLRLRRGCAQCGRRGGAVGDREHDDAVTIAGGRGQAR